MARPISIKLKDSKRELARIIGITQRLAKALTVAMRAVKKEERQANKLSRRKMRSLAIRLVKKTRKLQGTRLKARKGLTGKKALKLVLRSGGKARRAWTAAQVAKMCHMLTSGMSVRDVAIKLRRKVGAVRQRLFLEGISMKSLKKTSSKSAKAKGRSIEKRGKQSPTRKRRSRKSSTKVIKTKAGNTHEVWTPQEVTRLKAMLTQGLPLKSVAAKLHREVGAVRQRLSREGFSLRALKTPSAKPVVHSAPSAGEKKAEAKPEAAKDEFFTPPAATKEG